MVNEELQIAVETNEERFTQLAQNLGQTPEALLNEMVTEKEKEWALSQLDDAVAEARNSGFTPHESGQLLAEVKERVRLRSGENSP